MSPARAAVALDPLSDEILAPRGSHPSPAQADRAPEPAPRRRPAQWLRESELGRNVEILHRLPWPAVAVGAAWIVALLAFHVSLPRMLPSVALGALLLLPLGVVGLVLVADPGAASRCVGVDGEEWTERALLKSLGAGYVVINDIDLGASNIDHVVVGPAGVFAIETKCSGHPWASPREATTIDGAVRQARLAARTVERTIAAVHAPIVVQPIVVLWGGTRHWTDEKIEQSLRNVVPTVVGLAIARWAATLVDEGLDADARDVIASVVAAMHDG